MRYIHLVLLVAGVVPITGCGGGVKPVATGGKLLWEDGAPLAATSIRFVPADPAKGRAASGYSGKDGEFVMSTFSQGDGVIPGEYVVVVTKTQAATPTNAPAGEMSPEERVAAMKKFAAEAKTAPKIVDPIPPAYASEKSTPLKWKVEVENAKIELKLKRG